ncbi:hypothetical protein Tco_0201156 [Tanacetum coccineum]
MGGARERANVIGGRILYSVYLNTPLCGAVKVAVVFGGAWCDDVGDGSGWMGGSGLVVANGMSAASGRSFGRKDVGAGVLEISKDAVKGKYCLPTATIFAKLEIMSTMASAIICLAKNKKFNFSKYIFDNMVKNLEGGVKFLMYPRFVQVFLDNQVEGMTKHKGIYVTPSYTKKMFANMKREGKGFSSKVTPLFQTMMVQALEDIDPIPDEATNEEHVSTPSYDPSQSGKDRLQLTELMSLCTSLQEKVLDLEKAKTAQAKEIASLKKRVKQLEKRKKSRTSGLKRLRKGRKIADLDDDNVVTLIDETQERNVEEMLFDVQDDLQGEEVVAEKEVAKKKVSAADPVTTAGEVVPKANVEVATYSGPTTIIDELTLAQTLIEIKAAKPKAVTSAATDPRLEGL